MFEPDKVKFSRPAMMVFHALLYDDLDGLMASIFDVEPTKLTWRHLLTNAVRGAKRMADLASRYQR